MLNDVLLTSYYLLPTAHIPSAVLHILHTWKIVRITAEYGARVASTASITAAVATSISDPPFLLEGEGEMGGSPAASPSPLAAFLASFIAYGIQVTRLALRHLQTESLG